MTTQKNEKGKKDEIWDYIAAAAPKGAEGALISAILVIAAIIVEAILAAITATDLELTVDHYVLIIGFSVSISVVIVSFRKTFDLVESWKTCHCDKIKVEKEAIEKHAIDNAIKAVITNSLQSKNKLNNFIGRLKGEATKTKQGKYIHTFMNQKIETAMDDLDNLL